MAKKKATGDSDGSGHSLFKDQLADISEFLGDWDEEVRKDYRYWSLKQWDAADMEALAEEGRPALTFDKTRPIIQNMMGEQIMNRFMAQAIPKEANLNDVDGIISPPLSVLMKHSQQIGDAEQHETLMALDLFVAGMGCIELYVDYTWNANGIIRWRRVPIREIGWETTSVEPNLLDANFIIRNRSMSDVELKSIFGEDALKDIMEEAAAEGPERPGIVGGSQPTTKTREDRYPYNQFRPKSSDDNQYNARTRRARLYDRQYRETTYQSRIMVADLDDMEGIMASIESQGQIPMPQLDLLTPDGDAEMADFESRVESMNFELSGNGAGPIEMPDRIDDFPVMTYYRCYHTGSQQVKKETLPFPSFTHLFTTCFEDWSSEDGRRLFFGPMRAMRDPQQYANKFLSQNVHLFSSNPKGGLLYEEDFFTDEAEGLKKWNMASGAISVRKGMLSSGQTKFHHLKSDVNLSAAAGLMEHALGAIDTAAGSSAYATGTTGNLSRTSGEAISSVLSGHQKTQAIPFDSMRLYRKQMGRLLLSYYDAYIPPEEILRIVGEDDAIVVQAIKSGDLAKQYNIVVEEVPSSSNEKAQVFEVLMQSGFLPQLIQQGGAIPPELADFFPIPNKAAQQLKESLTSMFDVQQMNLEVQKLQLQQQIMQMQMAAQQPPAPPGMDPGMAPPGAEGQPPPEEIQ